MKIMNMAFYEISLEDKERMLAECEGLIKEYELSDPELERFLKGAHETIVIQKEYEEKTALEKKEIEPSVVTN